ncbi:hypothetical protein ABZP36_028402 [Zizania latifolia]
MISLKRKKTIRVDELHVRTQILTIRHEQDLERERESKTFLLMHQKHYMLISRFFSVGSRHASISPSCESIIHASIHFSFRLLHAKQSIYSIYISHQTIYH